jgi:hypothetical protein
MVIGQIFIPENLCAVGTNRNPNKSFKKQDNAFYELKP